MVTFKKVSIADVGAITHLLQDNQIDVILPDLFPSANQRSNHLNISETTWLADSIGLLEAMQQAGVRKLVFSSSAACYGPPKQLPIPEDHPCAPVSAFGDTKLMFEQILRTCERTMGLQYLCLRYSGTTKGVRV